MMLAGVAFAFEKQMKDDVVKLIRREMAAPLLLTSWLGSMDAE